MHRFDDRQNRLLWRAALGIYAVMRERDTIDRVSRIAAAWRYLTDDTRGVFPMLLMDPTQTAVTDRLVWIAHRAQLGHELCPELDAS